MVIGLFFRRNRWWQQFTSQHPDVRWGVLWLRLGGRGQTRLAWTLLLMSSHIVCDVSTVTKIPVVCRELHRPQAETADRKKQRRAAVWSWRGWQGPGLGGRQEEAVSSRASLPHPNESVLLLCSRRCSRLLRYNCRNRAAASGSKPHPQQAQALPSSDAILNCPACMTTLCLDCQRWEMRFGVMNRLLRNTSGSGRSLQMGCVSESFDLSSRVQRFLVFHGYLVSLSGGRRT